MWWLKTQGAGSRGLRLRSSSGLKWPLQRRLYRWVLSGPLRTPISFPGSGVLHALLPSPRCQQGEFHSLPYSGLSGCPIEASFLTGVDVVHWSALGSRCHDTEKLACYCTVSLRGPQISRWALRSSGVFASGSFSKSAAATTTFRLSRGNHGEPTLL